MEKYKSDVINKEQLLLKIPRQKIWNEDEKKFL